ncbi:uncharacterized protein LOC130892484 [Diorhabda carinulata]|uniref:uncharacterized protein LOC130892484 n=1 Tax=Diorhabda carinulata TaxID=1163345 RepID=UPI0025A0EB55|nr:uncharacterized protein LOC130892484 [Diorhabda carinulata]
MSSTKGKRIIDSLIRPTRPLKNQKDRRSSIYLYRITNDPNPESSIAEPKFGRGKKIHVWLNGEAHCYELTVNPNDFRTWNAILRFFTNSIKPVFGAITRLLALSSMQYIDCFDALDPNERYVALGAACKFKMAPGGYHTSSEKELYQRGKATKKFYSGEMNKKVLPFLKETGRKNLTIVYLVVNGKKSQIPQKLVLSSKELKDWVLIYRYLSKVLDIPDGISSICTIFGDELKKPSEFQHGYLYVAVSFKEEFVEMDYLGLFYEYVSKYKNSYTLAIHRASSRAGKHYSAFRKIERRANNSNSFKDKQLQSIPNMQKERKPKSSLKQIHQAGHKDTRTRSESQQTGRVVTIVEHNPSTRSDSAKMERLIRAELEKQLEAHDKNITELEQNNSKEDKQTMTYFNKRHSTEFQPKTSTSSNMTTFAELAESQRKDSSSSNMTAITELAVHSSETPSEITESISESLAESPTYTIVKIPSSPRRLTVMDASINTNNISIASGSKNTNIYTREVNSKIAMVKPTIRESTIVITNLKDPRKIKKVILVSSQNTPPVHLTNREDITVYNIPKNKYLDKQSNKAGYKLEELTRGSRNETSTFDYEKTQNIFASIFTREENSLLEISDVDIDDKTHTSSYAESDISEEDYLEGHSSAEEIYMKEGCSQSSISTDSIENA